MKKCLIVKTSSMGDVIHALPALTDAGRLLGDIRFDWVVEEGFREIPAWHPLVDRVIPVALRRWRRSPFSSETRQGFSAFKEALLRDQYDCVIDAQGLLKSAWIARWAQGLAGGYDRRSAREVLAALFYQRRIFVPKDMHAIERVRRLFAGLLGYDMPDYEPDSGLAFPREKVGDYIVFIHGTSRADKCWPVEKWKDLAQQITDTSLRVGLPWGNEAERKCAEEIASVSDRIEVWPRLSLTKVATLLAGAKGAVAMDTGLGHLSAAIGLPTISLYGPTDPARIGTRGLHQVHMQMSQSPETVWQALEVLW